MVGVGDLNRDGRLDVVTIDEISNTVNVLLNACAGSPVRLPVHRRPITETYHGTYPGRGGGASAATLRGGLPGGRASPLKMASDQAAGLRGLWGWTACEIGETMQAETMGIDDVNRCESMALSLVVLFAASCGRTTLWHASEAGDGERGSDAGGMVDVRPDRVAPPSGIFVATGSMAANRYAHTAALLPDGQVLVAGGWAGPGSKFAGAELYDPAAGVFSTTPGMVRPRACHATTLLANGTALIVGGIDASDYGVLAFAEIYDPATGHFVAAGSMAVARDAPTATPLSDGTVLLIGGSDGGMELRASAEIFDPASRSFRPTGSMAAARQSHCATLLPNGDVLVTGGYDGTTRLASAELYERATKTFTDAGNMSVARSFHTATLLPNGTVLIAGGRDADSVVLDSAELYDPVARRFTSTGRMSEPRVGGTATPLASGMVLLAGGFGGRDGNTFLASAELYDPATGTFASTGSMGVPRNGHTATALQDGRVLIAGGGESDHTQASAELFE